MKMALQNTFMLMTSISLKITRKKNKGKEGARRKKSLAMAFSYIADFEKKRSTAHPLDQTHQQSSIVLKNPE